MKILAKASLVLTTTLILFGIVAAPLMVASKGAKDCDGNALIYCGIDSPSDLNNILANGTGKTNQSSKELTALYAKYGYTSANSKNLKEGRVTKDNKVILNGKVIATNVYSMGRHKTEGSTDVPGISYPLWLRHPSHSFLSDSIDSYILLNYDGSFRMAIIESCGNIVPGTVKEKPPEKTYTLEVLKWNDLNGDSTHQSSEPYLAGWSFHVVGPGTDTTIITDVSGSAKLTKLKAGTYTIDEIAQDSWKAITPMHRIIVVSANTTVSFGNQKVVVPPVIPPVTPPETPPVITTVTTTPLPQSGPAEAAAGAVGLTTMGGAGFAWLKSKKALLSALLKIK